MRSFIGIDFDDQLKKEIYRLQQQFRSHAVKGRWKHSDNFHLTLKFLDEISMSQKQKIDELMKELCAGTGPFSLGISGAGIFPGRDAVRVLWLGLSGDLRELRQLYGSIDSGLVPIGFPQEKRAYNAHITIGQDIVFRTGFDEIKKETENISLAPFPVKSLYLFKSEQIQNKRVYTKVSEYILG